MAFGQEEYNAPAGLYRRPPPEAPMKMYTAVMPPDGYDYGYDSAGDRFIVPKGYEFAGGGNFGSDKPKPGVTTGPELNFEASVPNQYAPYGQYSLTGKPGPDYPDPYGLSQAEQDRLNAQFANQGQVQPSIPTSPVDLLIDENFVPQKIYNDVYNMSPEQRQQWATTRQGQRDVKSPKEQELINAVLNNTYDAMQFRPTDDAGNPLGSQMYGVNFALPTNYVPTGNEAIAMATTNPTTTNMTNLPAYSTDVSGAQQIISGTPQTPDEVNIMDYYGTMADRPVLQPETQLAPQIQTQEVQPGELQGDVLLGTTPTVTAVGGTTAQVGQPTIGPTVVASAEDAETVGKPSVTKTEAIQSYEAVNEAADAFQSAQLDLADVDPRATVQGQLALLQEQFAEGGTPIWAQGAMKQASALIAQRGLGSSTMAAEAITNALMQSAIPIAQQDSSFYQSVTMQNLVNEQEVEITKFNARLSSIFNDQAAENTARNINAQNENDTARFYSQLAQNVVLTNTAADNAMKQFNANSLNQATQFAAEIGLQADTINAQMANDMSQFNADQLNTVLKFNASMKDAREKFNVTNQIAIDANNIAWRRQVNTANTAATNAAIQTDVQNLLGLQQSALNNIWNHYDTLLNMSFQEEENAKDRAANVAIATLDAEARKQLAEDGANSSLIGDIFEGAVTILGSDSAWKRITSWF